MRKIDERHAVWVIPLIVLLVVGLLIAPGMIAIFGGTPATALVVASLSLFLAIAAACAVLGYRESRRTGAGRARSIGRGLRNIVAFWWSLGV